MGGRGRNLLALLLCLAPTWAGAIDMEYYTYNAFEETVSAFERVSLVLQDPAFTVFVLIFAVAGVLIGGLLVGARGIQGRQVNPIAFLIPVLVGVALFRGFVWPTGTLFVYDPVRNATQAVGDVPDAVVLMAGTLNKIERGVVEIIETASADPDAERSGALRYSLILNAINARGTNLSLERNLVNYYLDCGLPSMSLGFNGASQQEAERNTADLYETFARFAHPSFSTFGYTGVGDASATMTCATMWTDILNPALNGASALSDVRDVICAKTGFDMTVPTQAARCDGELQTLGSLYGLTPTSSLPFIRSSQIAIAMTNAMRSGDISVQTGALVNRQVMAEGMGVAEALDRWVPKVRGFMTAAVLGMVPLCLLFVVTPLLGKSLQLLAGLFLWLALWGVADAISVSMAADAAADSFDQMNQFGFSHMAFMLSPEGAIQSLGVFGKARAMALMMATVLSYALFQFGGYAFTNMANSWQNDVQQMGESAGRTAMMPEERAALMQRMATSPATEGTLNHYGFGAVAGGAAIGQGQQAREAQRAGQYVSPGLNGSGDFGAPPADNSYSTGAAAGSSQNTQGPQVERGGAQYVQGVGGIVPAAAAVPSRSATNGRAAEKTSEDDGELATVVVTGKSPVADEQRPNLFDNYIDLKTDIQTGGTIGGIEARSSVADRRNTDAFDVSRQAAAFTDEQQSTGTLSERDTLNELGHNANTAGRQAGQMSAGRTAAASEILENVSWNEGVSPDSADAALAAGRQERGEIIGATRAGSTNQYIGAAEQRARRSIAEGEQFARDGLADEVGRTDAISAGNRAIGTDRTLDEFGRESMIEGATVGQMKDAAYGTEVFETGTAADFARQQAHIGVAEQWARVDVVQSLGQIMGVDTSTNEGMRQLAISREGANQTITITGAAESKERVIAALQLDDRTADALRAHDGGYKVGVAIDSQGDVAYASVTAGGQTTLIDSTSIERGYTERASYMYEVGSGRALVLRDENLMRELDEAYGEGLIAGNYDETRIYGLASGIAKFVSEAGQSIDARSQEQVAYNMAGGLGAGLGGKSKSAEASTKGPVKASVQGGIDKTEIDNRSTGSDLAYQYALETIQEAHKQATAGYQIDHGVSPTEADRHEILERMTGVIQKTMSDLHDQAREEVDDAQQGHDVDPFPYNELPPAPMSDPNYANYKSPISRR